MIRGDRWRKFSGLGVETPLATEFAAFTTSQGDFGRLDNFTFQGLLLTVNTV